MDESTSKIAASGTPEIAPEIFSQTPKSANSIQSNSGFLIPESRDGFYGYNDEKSLQQVCDR